MKSTMKVLLAVSAAGMLSTTTSGQVTIESSYRLVRVSSHYIDEHNNNVFFDELDTFDQGEFDYIIGTTASLHSTVGPDLVEGELFVDGRSWQTGCDCDRGYSAVSSMEVTFTAPDGLPFRLEYSAATSSFSPFSIASMDHEIINLNGFGPSGPTIIEGTLREGVYTLIADMQPWDNSGGGFVVYGGSAFEFTLDFGYPPPVCAGDINTDGVIDTADLGGLIGAFGSDVFPYAFGDTNGDGTVDTADLGILIANFGMCDN